MTPIPRDKAFDSSLALLRDGNTFVMKRCRRYKTDVFETRMMLQKTICMRGEEAARLFYDESRFRRKAAPPELMQATLLGRGTVQELDGSAHRHRKAMFMSLMAPESIQQLVDLAEAQWREYIGRWRGMERVVLLDEVQQVLCRAVCAWAGVPLGEGEVEHRTKDLATLVDGAGGVGVRHFRARLARKRVDLWASGMVEQVREGKIKPPEGSALHVVALHRDQEGQLLEPRTAAVELINVLRPTVAVAWFVTFAAHALHEHPEWRERLRSSDDADAGLFAQEVRRYYPLFPYIAARVRRDFTWRGYRFTKGARVMLDLYGTGHEPHQWERPGEFRPERFAGLHVTPFNFIPQGGADHYTQHRCAGEWITIELLKSASRILASWMAYDVPAQDLHVEMARMPATPHSRFVISNVR